jgi:GT2 family glycosyltransferase/glycosyltransferase involved in cell wall biosynthesis
MDRVTERAVEAAADAPDAEELLRAQLAERDRALERAYAELRVRDQTVSALRAQLRGHEARWAALENSIGWPLLQRLQRLRARVSPPGSSRDQIVEALVYAVRRHDRRAFSASYRRIRRELSAQGGAMWGQVRLQAVGAPVLSEMQVDPVMERDPLAPHTASADIIVCVHNALEDVRRCLVSVLRHTTHPYRLILVDDGSAAPTRDYLHAFAAEHGAMLLRNETAVGYTRAANQGLRQVEADYALLLNSDTVVTEGWLDRLLACGEAENTTGIVGPLSNTASWQSIPEIEEDGDWAPNPLPAGMTVDDMARLVAASSARLFPPMPLLNGFCLLLKRGVIETAGVFDEAGFPEAYGEENDLVLRARAAGWTGRLADDAYVYHAQSRSYSSDRRRQLAAEAAETLARKHGRAVIQEGVAYCAGDRVLQGIRARSGVMVARQALLDEGRRRFAGRRVLFVLPVPAPGGGANVVLTEARALVQMGIEVTLFNLEDHRVSFSAGYPALELPVIYGAPDDLPRLAAGYDAVVATSNFSVEWLQPVSAQDRPPVLGYYVQDYEPYMYEEGSPGRDTAFRSYTLLPGMVRFTKTRWNRDEVLAHTGAECRVVGVSLDVDLFRPRPRSESEGADRPVRIVAMVRSSSPYRSPELTVRVLQHAAQEYGSRVEVVTFGGPITQWEAGGLTADARWQLAGVLSMRQVAGLLNTADIFVDFSTHQAMGLTALEAMACGAAVVVPVRGGTGEFARDGENALAVDTMSEAACEGALRRLIEDRALRARLQAAALQDVVAFYPERAAFNIAGALFG